LPVNEAVSALYKLQSQFNALCNCKVLNVQRANMIVLRAYLHLLRDSVLLYVILNKAINRISENLSELNKKEATQFLNCYKLYVRQTNAIIKIYDGAKGCSINLPTVEKVDESTIPSLESSIQGLESDGDGDYNNAEELPEEDLLSTNNNLLFNTANAFNPEEERDGSSESSSGEEEVNQPNNAIFSSLFFDNMPHTISNPPPRAFNPFLDKPSNSPQSSTNINIFSPGPVTGTEFNPFTSNPKTADIFSPVTTSPKTPFTSTPTNIFNPVNGSPTPKNNTTPNTNIFNPVNTSSPTSTPKNTSSTNIFGSPSTSLFDPTPVSLFGSPTTGPVKHTPTGPDPFASLLSPQPAHQNRSIANPFSIPPQENATNTLASNTSNTNPFATATTNTTAKNPFFDF